ncbi:MAG: hypothetical protein ACRDWG_04330 [Actinomycetes bacterium]|jgi:hypothetical protein
MASSVRVPIVDGAIDVDLDFLSDVLSAGADPHGRRITLWGKGIEDFILLTADEVLALARALLKVHARAHGRSEPLAFVLDRETKLSDLMETITKALA